MLGLKLKRSRGVSVTLGVHRLITRANKARDRRDWPAAAAAYTRALQADPSLGHIWVQLAHALKEQGRTEEAIAAYTSASGLSPADPDPHLHLGHLAHDRGNHTAAGQHYLAAFQANPGHADTAGALHRAIATARGRTRARLIEVIRATLPEADLQTDGADRPDRTPPTPPEAASLVFDASDLIGYYAHARLPTGIQRVQIQAITHALHQGGGVRVCCFIDGRDDWLEIPPALFLAVVDLSLQSGDRAEPAWIMALHRLHLRLNLARPFVFPPGATLVNLGASWQLHNYFLFVRAAKAASGIRYIPFVHDLIPIVAPEHFTSGAKREVVPWVLGIFEHADHFLANSEATKRDLLRTAALLGHTVDPEAVSVVRLDADFRAAVAPSPQPPSSHPLKHLELDGTPFVLLVSTVESRKGHLTAFEAWHTLIERHGPERVPLLVCVGKRGWLAEAVYARLEQDPTLATRVRMLSGVADAELAALYHACLFTLYPSRYEGWGLPITEALCYGKPVIASDTSSLPEAGGPFAVYVPPGDAPALADAAERLAFDAAARAAIEARIAAGFRPRTWSEIAAQIRTAVSPPATGPAARPLPRPVARFGDFHALTRGTALRIWPGARSSEPFRVGTGWRAPDADASWTRPQGGELAIALPADPGSPRFGAPRCGPLRVGLLLVGPPDRDVIWTVAIRGFPLLSGTLAAGRRKWATATLPDPEAATLAIRLRAEPADPDPADPDDETGIGLAGFFLYPAADVAAGMRLLEAIALGNLDDIDANRPPPPPPQPMDAWPA